MAVGHRAQLRALVYRGPGTGPFSAEQARRSLESCFSVGHCTAAILAEGSWSRCTDLLVIPGGRDLPYHSALAGEANARIRDFVEEGGAYLGLCAGAYYGARLIAFDEGGPEEIVGERELGFFSGRAEGPVFGKQYVYESEEGASAARVSLFGEELAVYYNGGCCFTGGMDARVEVCGSYLNSCLGSAAVLRCSVGRGCAILSGVHLEYRFEDLKSLSLPSEMLTALSASEPRRKSLFEQLVSIT